jgi:hypothetical protein
VASLRTRWSKWRSTNHQAALAAQAVQAGAVHHQQGVADDSWPGVEEEVAVEEEEGVPGMPMNSIAITVNINDKFLFFS